MASEKRCGRRGSGRWASRCQGRCSRTMVFGLQPADENDVARRRDGLACRERRAGDLRRRWHSGHQHQATDAAIIDTVLGVGVAGRGRLVACNNRMADDAARSGRRSSGACRAKARDQARQRNRVSRRQRNNAPLQWPPGEILAHGLGPRPGRYRDNRHIISRRYRDYHSMNPSRRALFPQLRHPCNGGGRQQTRFSARAYGAPRAFPRTRTL